MTDEELAEMELYCENPPDFSASCADCGLPRAMSALVAAYREVRDTREEGESTAYEAGLATAEFNLKRWNELKAERDGLSATLEGLKKTARRVMAEECAPDEKHCACVPFLRREVGELRSIIRAEQMPEGFDVPDDATTELAVKCAELEAERDGLRRFVYKRALDMLLYYEMRSIIADGGEPEEYMAFLRELDEHAVSDWEVSFCEGIERERKATARAALDANHRGTEGTEEGGG